jgi:hypothetical protein
MVTNGMARYRAALEEAAARVHLDTRDAVILHIRANAVYHLPGEGIVARIRFAQAGQDAMFERATAAVQVAHWLISQGFPATEPLDIDQPVTVPDHVATFWRYVAVTGRGRDTTALGRMIRRLHSLPPAPVSLPPGNVLGSLRADLATSTAVPDNQLRWLLASADDLEQQYRNCPSVLGTGLVHGDAHAGNLLHSRGGVVLTDWDSVGHGPRELDLVPMSLGYRFGRAPAEWQAFCAAYGADPSRLPSLPLLQRLRELHSLAAYVRNADNPAFRTELTKRITSITTSNQAEPWRAL